MGRRGSRGGAGFDRDAVRRKWDLCKINYKWVTDGCHGLSEPKGVFASYVALWFYNGNQQFSCTAKNVS